MLWQFFQAYCNSKLCNVLFTHELAKRLQGSSVTCYSVHPGNSNIQHNWTGNIQHTWTGNIQHTWTGNSTPGQAGAQTTLHCALQEGIEPLSGRYFSCCEVQEVSDRAKDDAVARKLWEVSESLCGLSS
uniref:Dehydrogenase/reductase (SDR family) member 13b.1 n=1 Tax=Amphiprion ocellaris TaxID=80972 RepID=A0AAQ5YP43_AMPOC